MIKRVCGFANLILNDENSNYPLEEHERDCDLCQAEFRIKKLEGVVDAVKKLEKEVVAWAEDAGGYTPAWFDVEDALKKLKEK